MTGRAVRCRAAAAFWAALVVSVLLPGPALAGPGSESAAGFAATYSELARSPAGYAASWYSGAVTKHNKFIYGMGHSHASYNNNGLWLYDPATNKHISVAPDTGSFYRYDKGATGKYVPKSGRWAKLDPARDKALVAYFGGTDIYAPTNRNNHQAFYMPGVDQFWIMAGTAWDNGSWASYARFDLKTRRWEHVSKPWSDPTKNDLADFSKGMIAGTMSGWAAPNAATAVCTELDTAVLFGGMNDSGGRVRIIEPNPAGPEPYRWAKAPTKAPIHLPAENVRHNAACVGDTVYFVSGQERLPDKPNLRTPDPAPFWKFHVPSRTWTKLNPGPAGSYFTVMTYDAAANALLVYGGSGSNRLWAYDLKAGAWHNLTGTVPKLPYADMHTGGYIHGFGHVYKGGKRYNPTGKELNYSASSQMMKIVLKRVPGASAPIKNVTTKPPLRPHDPGGKTEPLPTTAPGIGREPQTANPKQSIAKRVRDRELARLRSETRPVGPAQPGIVTPGMPPPAPPVAKPIRGREQARPPGTTRPVGPAKPGSAVPGMPLPPAAGPGSMAIAWKKIPLPGSPKSPQGSMKHQRLAEGPDGRVYLLGGDWGGPGGENSGRQEVYSFDPLSSTGDWRLEAPYCGTKANPVHWHTDEAGVAWDAKRGVFWKLSGTEYGPDDSCLAEGRSVKAKVIQFNPATRLWTVPAGFSQMRFGYVTNGVLDPVKDEMIQIADKKAFHLNLQTGKWSEYPLWGGALRFNAIAARLGRHVWWTNRKGVMESYNLDTHGLKAYTKVPWTVANSGWLMEMVFALPDRLLVVHPTSGPRAARFAATFDPATQQWTPIAPGQGWGNAGMLHSSGRLILMGGGINGPQDLNKQVWVGAIVD